MATPLRLEGRCPRCAHDLEYDLAKLRYCCVEEGCGYEQQGLMPKPGELVVRRAEVAVVPSVATVEKEAEPAGYAYVDVTEMPSEAEHFRMADVAKGYDISEATVRNILRDKRVPIYRWVGFNNQRRVFVRRVDIDCLGLRKRRATFDASTAPVVAPVESLPVPVVAKSDSGETLTRTLAAGTVTLTIDVKLVDLTPQERTWLFELIDLVKGH